MASSNEGNFNLRKTPSLQRNILHSSRMEIASRAERFTGQRPNPNVIAVQRDCRSWLFILTSLKVDAGHLNYPASGRDSAERGLGCTDNPRLSCLAESSIVNVGDSRQDVKDSSHPMLVVRVGAAIVVGARESRVQGEGPQPAGIVKLSKRMQRLGNPCRYRRKA